jgi:hypothetical protein
MAAKKVAPGDVSHSTGGNPKVVFPIHEFRLESVVEVARKGLDLGINVREDCFVVLHGLVSL